MTQHTITRANQVFLGGGYDPRLSGVVGRPGIEIMPTTMANLGAPAVADADFLVKAATGAEIPDAAETVTYTPATDGTSPLDSDAVAETLTLPDGSTDLVFPVGAGATYGRNIVCVASSGTTTVACTVLVSGYDYLGRAMTESFTLAATATSVTATGKKAFAYVSDIAITAAAAMTGTTLNIGTGSVLGLPYRLEEIGHVLAASLGGVQELINVASNATVVAAVATTASATTGDVRGTITFNGTLDGSAEPIVWMYVSGRDTPAGLVGVTQA